MLRSEEKGVRNWNVIMHQRKDIGLSGKDDQHVIILSVGTKMLCRNVSHVLSTDDDQQPRIPTTSTILRREAGISQGNTL